MQNWLVVSSLFNFEQTASHGFSVQGFKSRQRKNVMERMSPGDKLAYYIKGEKIFAATAVVTSLGFENTTPIWKALKGDDDYRWRVTITPGETPRETDWVPADLLIPNLALVAKMPPKRPYLAFQGNLHPISEGDFELIRRALVGQW